MRALLRLLKPSEFEHISAVIALYRPGPMGMNSHTNYAQRKNGLQEIDGIHPELAEPLKEILGPTFGLIVYQEQVMAAAQKVAGYTLGQADLLRRRQWVMKKPEELAKQFEIFSQGMVQNKFSKPGHNRPLGYSLAICRLCPSTRRTRLVTECFPTGPLI